MPRAKLPTPIAPRKFYAKLTAWYSQNARPFPWRGETRPYQVWISEIILVQTTAAVGVERYRRFLTRFPTLRSLANAAVDDLMKEWEGLGYYHRARLLHRAAQIISTTHGGRFPRDYDAIRELPGVGDYVAAAVHNFCFGGRRPPLDANVMRVGARIFGVEGDVRAPKTRREVHQRFTELMTTGDGATWTDALIDLGASVCSPRAPKCGICPVRQFCTANHAVAQMRMGLPQSRITRKVVNVACGIIRRADGRILIAQRLETGLLPNLWEFPGGKRDGNEALAATCAREIQEELGIKVEVGQRRMVVAHAYSHYAVRLHVFECRFRRGKPRAIGCQRFRWSKVEELKTLAFPMANRRIIAMLETDGAALPE